MRSATAPAGAAERADSRSAVAERLEELLNRLRPEDSRLIVAWFDSGHARHVDGWMREACSAARKRGSAFALVEQYSFMPPTACLALNPEHALLRAAIDAAPQDGTPMGWLLLAAYAYINEQLRAVTNDHELEFQRSVLNALHAGELSG